MYHCNDKKVYIPRLCHFYKNIKMKSLFVLLCVFVTFALTSAVQVEVFRTNYHQKTLSEAFGGVQVSYGNQNVLLWENGEGIDVVYPAGRYL